MRNKREHKRFDLIDIQGRMVLANKVEIEDISLGGMALRADRRLEVGGEYTIKLGDEKRNIDVRGVIVRSTLIGMEAGADGENVLIYAAGMKFKEGAEDKITDFLNSVDHQTKEEKAPLFERRLHVRFQIISPQKKVLAFPLNFKVKDISFSSMIIQCEQPLERETSVPINLYLDDEGRLDFTGKVFSCRRVEEEEQACYEIELTYSDLGGKGKATLKEFIDYLIMWRSEKKEA